MRVLSLRTITFMIARSAHVNKGVTKDVGLSKRSGKKSKIIVGSKKVPTNVYIAPLYNMSFHCEESVMKWKYLYHKRMTLETKLSKEDLTFEEVVKLLEVVIVNYNENLRIVHINVDDMSDKMVEHFVQKMQSKFELSMVGDVTYFLDFKVKQMKDYTFDSQSIYAGSSCTHLLWSNQMIKDDNEDVNQDVPNNMYDMMVTEFPNQK